MIKKANPEVKEQIASQVLADYTHYGEIYRELETLLWKDFGLIVAHFNNEWRMKDLDTHIELLPDDGSNWTLSKIIQYGIDKRGSKNEDISTE